LRGMDEESHGLTRGATRNTTCLHLSMNSFVLLVGFLIRAYLGPFLHLFFLLRFDCVGLSARNQLERCHGRSHGFIISLGLAAMRLLTAYVGILEGLWGYKSAMGHTRGWGCHRYHSCWVAKFEDKKFFLIKVQNLFFPGYCTLAPWCLFQTLLFPSALSNESKLYPCQESLKCHTPGSFLK
jgi:hypothetical protein